MGILSCWKGPLRSIVVGNDGIIVAVGNSTEIEQEFKGASFAKEIDATGKICYRI